MPTRKQRRRRQKLRRHDYEEVWVDEEGRELDVDPAAIAPPTEPKRRTNGTARTAKAGRPRDAKGRPIREIQPPSWQRILKRTMIFFPIMYLVISLTNKNLALGARLLNAAVLAMLLIPTMYVMDRVAYRTYLKRSGRSAQPTPRGGKRAG